jgi:hypothetical protein
MARKAFIAAFIIDEGSYTPEPGPVDHHFVAPDLAQSSFGEQPGVEHIVVWDSADDLIAEHCQRGPITIDYLSGDQPAPNRGSSTHQRPAPRTTGTVVTTRAPTVVSIAAPRAMTS